MTPQLLLLDCHPVRPYQCETCGDACATGRHAPGQILGEPGAWYREPGPWECELCSVETWRVYLEACRERRALIQVSAWLGYPARRADVERLRSAGEQMLMEAL